MKIAVITANFGNFDTVKEIPPQSVPFDRYYYTEKNSPFPFHTIDNRLRAKVFKMLPHQFLEDYDVYVWVDGNVQIKNFGTIEEMVKPLKNAQVSISRHPERMSIYEEADFICKEIKKGNRYLKNRYSPESLQREINYIGLEMEGLYWCGLFARRNTQHVNSAFEDWYMKNVLWTNFDQINFVKVVEEWKLQVTTFAFGPYYENDFYRLTPHKK